ncbi:hypothetical protein ElyMa_005749000 [Elysia marginata]|uniref:Uncharacterized protein n=1 Tax=Elysia marginata TaxID=1093978 RepID=A0AAV4FL61_9GAST|nr:hypothetical protein ElyMa_005749000 [Elysia marginata]
MSVKINQERAMVRRKQSWQKKTHACAKRKLLTPRSQYSTKTLIAFADVDSILELIDEVLAFTEGASTQIELFFVLLGFVNLNKTKTVNRLKAAVKNQINTLRFIMDRLNSHVIGRSFSHICAMEKQVRVLLQTGVATLEKMFALAPMLQQASKDIETAWVGDVDPSKHMYYK